MRVLFDTNIVLDLLLDRPEFANAAIELFGKVERGEIAGYLCGTTVTTVHYLVSKAIGKAKAAVEIENLLSLFEVAPVNRAILESALKSGFLDFEDAVIHEAAVHTGVDAIVTRNLKDFKGSRISVYHSIELAGILKTTPVH